MDRKKLVELIQKQKLIQSKSTENADWMKKLQLHERIENKHEKIENKHGSNETWHLTTLLNPKFYLQEAMIAYPRILQCLDYFVHLFGRMGFFELQDLFWRFRSLLMWIMDVLEGIRYLVDSRVLGKELEMRNQRDEYDHSITSFGPSPYAGNIQHPW